jgi:hypothetical protein
MLPGETMQFIQHPNKADARFAQFAFLMISFKPNFFNAKV